MASTLVSESAIKKLLYDDTNTVEKTKKMVETILQELVVDTNPLNLVTYLSVLIDYTTKNQGNKEVCRQIIKPIFTIALGDEVAEDNSSSSTSSIFWVGSLRITSQHNNYLVRTSSAQLLGHLLLLCVESQSEYKKLLALVSPILQHLVSDSHKHVSRKAVIYFSKLQKAQYPSVEFKKDFFVSLLSLHGGQANAAMSSKEDRLYIYNILVQCELPNFHIFCACVTFLQNCILRLQTSDDQLKLLSSTTMPTDASAIISQNEMDMCKCLSIIKSNHPHFNDVYELAQRVRQHPMYGHLPNNLPTKKVENNTDPEPDRKSVV